MTDAAREWLELLPCATRDERRTLIDTGPAAAVYADALRAAGVPLSRAFEPETFEVLARWLSRTARN